MSNGLVSLCEGSSRHEWGELSEWVKIRSLRSQELRALISLLPASFLILGDFIIHSPLFGSERLDARLDTVLCVLNKKNPTCYSTAHLTFTSIDSSVASSIFFSDFSWKVLQNSYGSDHFSLTIEQKHLSLPFWCEPRSGSWNKRSGHFRDKSCLGP